MASNTRIPKAELTGIYGAMVKRMSRKMLGDVPEPVEVAWHNRKVLNFSFSLGRKAQKWDQCDENLKSFAHMAVASLVVADGRITRIYAIRNPHKLARLDEEAKLSR
jgi:hypothetical protein